MTIRFLPILSMAVLIVGPSSAATPEQEVRATFDRFVAAQNAHDIRAVESLLLDSPQFLWVTRGSAVWGRGEALKRFETLYAGTWHLEPEAAAFRLVLSRPHVAQIFVPIVYSVGPPGQAPQKTTFLMNQVLVKTDSGWKVASILPIPVPPPAN